MGDRITSFRKDRLLSAKNYALYYGYGKVKELSLFDLAIVDPNGLEIHELEHLRLTNTMVITYVSVIEVHPTEPIFQQLTDHDFLTLDGERLRNEAFGTYLVSLRSQKWINHLLNKIHYHFQEIESDGLFLDTIGDLESRSLPNEIRQQQIIAAVNLLSILRMLYPHHLFIQNNGLELIVQETAAFIDGICWENPPFTLEESKDWTEIMTRKLSALKKQHQLVVFLLLEAAVEKERKAYQAAREIAKREDFLLYNASESYVNGVNIIKG